jgi:hypothetical protein
MQASTRSNRPALRRAIAIDIGSRQNSNIRSCSRHRPVWPAKLYPAAGPPKARCRSVPLPVQPRPEATESQFTSGIASPSATQVGPALRRRQRVRGIGRPAAGGHWGPAADPLKPGHRAGPMISHSIWSAYAGDRPRCRSCRSRNGPFRINRVRSNRRTRFTRRPHCWSGAITGARGHR